jgi:large subunit ribosomal protein L18e
MTNPELKIIIRKLRTASKKDGQVIWRALADELDRAKRRRNAVNLSKINRYTDDGDVVAIPGKVLGSGLLEHPVTIAAFSFSRIAREKITLAGGRNMSLVELHDEGVEPSKIKILK